jgi:AcrR family transcriptional regulator
MTVAAKDESLRARQRRFAMAEIERIALDLFAEHGFDAVSVDDIVEAAGSSQRTFFRYFETKDAVVLAYERQTHDRFLAVLRSRPDTEGPVTALVQAYVTTSAVAADDADLVRKRARVVAAAPVLWGRAIGHRRHRTQEIADALIERDGIAAGRATVAQRRRARVVAAAVSAVAQAEWDAWTADDARRNPSESIRDGLDMLRGGLIELDRPGALRGRTLRARDHQR